MSLGRGLESAIKEGFGEYLVEELHEVVVAEGAFHIVGEYMETRIGGVWRVRLGRGLDSETKNRFGECDLKFLAFLHCGFEACDSAEIWTVRLRTGLESATRRGLESARLIIIKSTFSTKR